MEFLNSDVGFNFTPRTIQEAAKVVRRALLTDDYLYNALIASIYSALSEMPEESLMNDAAKRIADRIIGREE